MKVFLLNTVENVTRLYSSIFIHFVTVPVCTYVVFSVNQSHHISFNPFPPVDTFSGTVIAADNFSKHCGRLKVKLLMMSNFFFGHDIFNFI